MCTHDCFQPIKNSHHHDDAFRFSGFLNSKYAKIARYEMRTFHVILENYQKSFSAFLSKNQARARVNKSISRVVANYRIYRNVSELGLRFKIIRISVERESMTHVVVGSLVLRCELLVRWPPVRHVLPCRGCRGTGLYFFFLKHEVSCERDGLREIPCGRTWEGRGNRAFARLE